MTLGEITVFYTVQVLKVSLYPSEYSGKCNHGSQMTELQKNVVKRAQNSPSSNQIKSSFSSVSKIWWKYYILKIEIKNRENTKSLRPIYTQL